MHLDFIANGSTAFHADMWEDKPQNSVRSIIGWDDPDIVPLRIGIAGAFGTDKNILARSLADTLEITLIERVPRTASSAGFELNKHGDIDGCMAMWLAQLVEQCEIVEFVSDNTILTYVAYANYLAERSGNRRAMALATAMTNLTMTVVNEQYSIVFYAPPTGDIKNNGTRSRDKKFQAEIDAYIRKFLTNFDVDYFPVTGTPVQKFDLAMAFLHDAGFFPREE